MAFEMTSTAFKQGETIPKQYTGDGRNVSPPLKWSDPPGGTRSMALVCEDPDAPRGTFTHWVIFNLPAEARGLSEAVPSKATLPDGSVQGINDFGNAGYGGPAPPAGKPHRYFFKLFAIDHYLELKTGVTKPDLLTALKGHVLSEAELMGTYGRMK
jgi:Raf kinase inhibitor-like YbhB/YbcL family protein